MHAAIQVKGQQCQALQTQCTDLQQELVCAQAEHAKVCRETLISAT